MIDQTKRADYDQGYQDGAEAARGLIAYWLRLQGHPDLAEDLVQGSFREEVTSE